jgi:hypothetical protein
MVALMETNLSAGIVGAYGIEGTWVLWEGVPLDEKLISGREACRRRLLGGDYVFGSATSVLYRSSLVRERDPFFNESNPNASDSEACMEVLQSCDFGFVHQVLTFSRKREGSLLEESKKLNTLSADLLHELVTYGPIYLSVEELRARLHELVDDYYSFLAASMLHKRGRPFWEYHKRKLAESDIRFSRRELMRALFRKVFGRFTLNTGKAAQRWGL